MTTQIVDIDGLADLLHLEGKRGIINAKAVLEEIKNTRRIPKLIHDVRGHLRLEILRDEEDANSFEVMQHMTDQSVECVGEIF